MAEGSSSMINILELPSLCLSTAFSWLKFEELCLCVGPVCKKFNNITQLSTSISNIRVSQIINYQQANGFVQRLNLIKVLTIDQNIDPETTLLHPESIELLNQMEFGMLKEINGDYLFSNVEPLKLDFARMSTVDSIKSVNLQWSKPFGQSSLNLRTLICTSVDLESAGSLNKVEHLSIHGGWSGYDSNDKFDDWNNRFKANEQNCLLTLNDFLGVNSVKSSSLIQLNAASIKTLRIGYNIFQFMVQELRIKSIRLEQLEDLSIFIDHMQEIEYNYRLDGGFNVPKLTTFGLIFDCEELSDDWEELTQQSLDLFDGLEYNILENEQSIRTDGLEYNLLSDPQNLKTIIISCEYGHYVQALNIFGTFFELIGTHFVHDIFLFVNRSELDIKDLEQEDNKQIAKSFAYYWNEASEQTNGSVQIYEYKHQWMKLILNKFLTADQYNKYEQNICTWDDERTLPAWLIKKYALPCFIGCGLK